MKLETILDSLGECDDNGLRSIEARCEVLLKQHDTERKDKALEQARATLAAVGLSLKDLARKPGATRPKGPVYHVGHSYQHPANKSLVWSGKGKKPSWLVTLEGEGGKAVELPANDGAPTTTKKTA